MESQNVNIGVGLTLLAQARLPLHFLGEAFQTATYLINRLLTPILDHNSPIERLTKVQPDHMFLKVFGCECYNSTKFIFKSTKCVFIGYSLQHKGYKCFDPFNNKVYITRHVQFNETMFPYVEMVSSHTTGQTVFCFKYSSFYSCAFYYSSNGCTILH